MQSRCWTGITSSRAACRSDTAQCAARTAAEKLRGLSVRACIVDFNADVRAELTHAQRTDLKAARRAQPSSFATRSMGLF